jgi:hypothetical protein
MTEAQIAAIAGEHYVAHKIAMLGFIPTLVRQRMPRIDLLVSSAKGDRTVSVQVKSTFNAMREPSQPGKSGPTFDLRFPLGHRAVTSSEGTTFFCFVDLRRVSPSAVQDVYIVPATALKQEYDGVYLRKYSQLHYQRPWQTMQPFRNNWDPIANALHEVETAVEAMPRTIRSLPVESLAQRWRNSLVVMDSVPWPVQ